MGEGSQVPVGDGHVTVHRSAPVGSEGDRCLVVPPFGVPARWLAPLTDAIAHRGVEAISFDARDHVGDGSGSVGDFRISQLAEDCAHLIDALAPTCVLAVSLGARGALRALARHDGEVDAVLVTPVVDVRPTLGRILGRDWFEVPVDDLPELVPVLEHEVRSVPFRADCLEHRLYDRDDAVEDLVAAGGRMRLIAGSEDPWVDRATVVEVAAAASARRSRPVAVETVAAEHHLIHADPELAMRMIGAAVDAVEDLGRGEEAA